MSAQRMPQSRQGCFCIEKAETSFLALLQKRCDFLTKQECSIRRVFGTFPSDMKPGEWSEFFQNYLKFSCWEAVPIVPIFLSILHFVGCFPQVFGVVLSLVRAGRFIIYFDSHQPILSSSTHYCSIWQVLLLKSFSFFFPPLSEASISAVLFTFPKEAQYIFWLIKALFCCYFSVTD